MINDCQVTNYLNQKHYFSVYYNVFKTSGNPNLTFLSKALSAN